MHGECERRERKEKRERRKRGGYSTSSTIHCVTSYTILCKRSSNVVVSAYFALEGNTGGITAKFPTRRARQSARFKQEDGIDGDIEFGGNGAAYTDGHRFEDAR